METSTSVPPPSVPTTCGPTALAGSMPLRPASPEYLSLMARDACSAATFPSPTVLPSAQTITMLPPLSYARPVG